MCTLIGAIQPVGQKSCRLVRRLSVERHERAADSGRPHNVGPPAVGRNGRNLDEIRASRDGFFEAMNDVGHQGQCGILTRRDSSEAIEEGAAIASPIAFRGVRGDCQKRSLLVLRRMFQTIDHEDADGPFGRFQLESELFDESREH
jgi:hypothetical protein